MAPGPSLWCLEQRYNWSSGVIAGKGWACSSLREEALIALGTYSLGLSRGAVAPALPPHPLIFFLCQLTPCSSQSEYFSSSEHLKCLITKFFDLGTMAAVWIAEEKFLLHNFTFSPDFEHISPHQGNGKWRGSHGLVTPWPPFPGLSPPHSVFIFTQFGHSLLRLIMYWPCNLYKICTWQILICLLGREGNLQNEAS